MTAILELRMRDRSDHVDTVDLDALSPRARALAEAWHLHALHNRGAVILRQTSGTRADLIRPDDRERYAQYYDLAVPDSIVWTSWSVYPEDSTMEPARYLEQQAKRLPAGYAPVAAGKDQPVPSAAAAAADDEWLTLDEVLHELRAAGRPIEKATWRAYVARDQAPEAGRRIGATPQWRRRDVAAFLAGTWRQDQSKQLLGTRVQSLRDAPL
jgi:hypothetical protein